MKTFTFLGAAAMVWIAPAMADSGDDTSNNLFSDLAPLLALFGEQFAKQFMSDSMGWLDHIIFAMAPLGILTAIVAAIRVGGPSWLRAVIGRARENRATVEMELMSSTSHEVCELWNGEGIIRSMGRPQIQQIIYLEHMKDNPETFGFYTVDTAAEAGLLQEESSDDLLTAIIPKISLLKTRFPFDRPQKADEEQPAGRGETPASGSQERVIGGSTLKPKQSADNDTAPNISLNLHGGNKTAELVGVALFGIALQLGALVFCGFSVYHTSFRERFPKNGHHVQPYAFPTMASGTIILVIGMLLCSFVVEQSTVERKYTLCPGSASGSNSQSSISAFGVLWLQRSHTVSDQAFESFALFGKDLREHILTSRRKETKHADTTEGTISSRSRPWIGKISANRTQDRTMLGVLLGLIGFVLQFEGLRGMNWSASIIQLVCVLLMTIGRAWVRRGLIALPVSRQVPKDHEIDWLAWRMANCNPRGNLEKFWLDEFVEDETGNCPSVCPPITNNEPATEQQATEQQATEQQATEQPRQQETRDHLVWEIPTDPKSRAYVGNLRSGQTSDAPCNTTAQFALKLRRHLGQLTNWTVPSRVSVAVADSIEILMNTFLKDGNDNTFTWRLKVNSRAEEIEFELKRTPEDRAWKIDEKYIEAALSLWLFHAHQTERVEGKMQKSSKRKVDRILGSSTPWLRRDIGWWTGIELNQDKPSGHSTIGYMGIEDPGVRYDNEESGSLNSSNNEAVGPCLVASGTSLESSLAQHIFSSFVWAVAKHIPEDKLNGKADTSIVRAELFKHEDPNTLLSVGLENKVLARVAHDIHQTGLGSLQDAYLCIIPPLSDFRKLPMDAIVDLVRQEMRDHELVGHWEIISPIYIRLYQESEALGTEHPTFQRVATILMHLFWVAHSTLRRWENQYRTDSVLELSAAEENILAIFKPDENAPGSLPRLLQNFRRLYRKDLDLEFPENSATASAPPAPDHSMNIFRHPEIFSLIDGISNAWELSVISEKNAMDEDIFGWTPLHYAAVMCNAHAVKELCKMRAKLNATDMAGRTPMQYAIHAVDRKKQPDFEEKLGNTLSTLLENGAGTDIRGRDGAAALHYAVRLRNCRAVEKLLQAGASVDIRDSSNMTPLHWAAYTGSTNTIATLLANGSAHAARENYGRTPLHLAVMSGKADAVEKLLGSQQVELDAKDRDGRTPLHVAALKGDVVQILVNHINGRYVDSITPEAAEQHRPGRDGFFSSEDNRGLTPLIIAIIFGNNNAAATLIQLKADINWEIRLAILFARSSIIDRETIFNDTITIAILIQKVDEM